MPFKIHLLWYHKHVTNTDSLHIWGMPSSSDLFWVYMSMNWLYFKIIHKNQQIQLLSSVLCHRSSDWQLKRLKSNKTFCLGLISLSPYMNNIFTFTRYFGKQNFFRFFIVLPVFNSVFLMKQNDWLHYLDSCCEPEAAGQRFCWHEISHSIKTNRMFIALHAIFFNKGLHLQWSK